jgi:uncharacterized membrane protein YGL010W
MRSVRLDEEWSRLMARYRADHRHPVNQVCHAIGIPLIAGSLPIGATIVGLPAAAAMFCVGWTFQLVGHAFEGKKPSFVDDRRALLVGVLWWLQKAGMCSVEEAYRPS